MSEQWTFEKRLEVHGDCLYSSDRGRYLVACGRPSDLDDIEGYILDIQAIKQGEVELKTDSQSGFIFAFPRQNIHPICEQEKAARKLHKALHELGVAPAKLEWKTTFDVEAPL